MPDRRTGEPGRRHPTRDVRNTHGRVQMVHLNHARAVPYAGPFRSLARLRISASARRRWCLSCDRELICPPVAGGNYPSETRRAWVVSPKRPLRPPSYSRCYAKRSFSDMPFAHPAVIRHRARERWMVPQRSCRMPSAASSAANSPNGQRRRPLIRVRRRHPRRPLEPTGRRTTRSRSTRRSPTRFRTRADGP